MTSRLRNRSAIPGKIWCWRRRIDRAERDRWIALVQQSGHTSWALSEKPEQLRSLLTVYLTSRAAADRLVRQWGGRTESVAAKQWLSRPLSAPLKIGSKLEIIHEKSRSRETSAIPRLHIPHGLAFGSGEHATTSMLLRALVRQPNMPRGVILDLGTGSGILALAARMLGGANIVATDWDAEAIRTAERNEKQNFRRALIRWRRADVLKLRALGRYHLVLANLYSEILIDAAVPISQSVAPAGELWLSGILRTQEKEVVAAYKAKGLKLADTIRRGKWVLLQWQKQPSQEYAGGLIKSAQAK